MLNEGLVEVGDGIDTAKGSSSVSGISRGEAAGWLVPKKSLAEIVRMPERRGVVHYTVVPLVLLVQKLRTLTYQEHGSY